jgi:hypothetical protein
LLDFWIETTAFTNVDDKKIEKCANDIFNDYLTVKGKRCILKCDIISASEVERLSTQFEPPAFYTKEMFESFNNKVEDYLHKNTFAHFLASSWLFKLENFVNLENINLYCSNKEDPSGPTKVVMKNQKVVVGRAVQGLKDHYTDNLNLVDDRISREHGKFRSYGTGYVDYYDLSSKYGTQIKIHEDEEEYNISTNPGKSQILIDGDEIKLSSRTTIKVEFEPAKPRRFSFYKSKPLTKDEILKKFLDKVTNCMNSVGATRFG